MLAEASERNWFRGRAFSTPPCDTGRANALQQDANGLNAAATAWNAAKVTLDLAQNQFQSGYTGYPSLLNAEQTYQQASINLVQAQANRFADTVALFQALGGGWWNRAELSKN